MSLSVGQVVDGKYRIVRLLGQGAMGAVFEGENVRIHRRVAIKVLHAAVAARKDLVDRFEREAQAAGRIGSAHIVEVLDLGELPDGSRYLVMEYLDGEALSGRMQSCGRMLPGQILPILRQLLVGLGAAHQAGIVHRDMKPDNVFLLKELAGQPDFVKVLDFGVSKFNVLNSEEASMTKTGAVMGTPYYMSPEQAKGARDLDARSDLFAVGVILYEAVTGNVPFDGETFNELMFKIALQDPPPPETIVPGLDPAIGRMIRKAMAREPGQRFQSAADFIAAIDEWLRTGRVSHSQPPLGGAALAEGPTIPAPGGGPGGPHGRTKAEWSTSEVRATKPSKAPLVAALAVALLGAGGAGAYLLRDKIGLGGATAAAAPSAVVSEPPKTEEKATPPAASDKPAADAPPSSAEAAASQSAPPAESAAPVASSGSSSSGSKPTKTGGGATKPPAAPTTAKPTAAPPPTSTGRQPRENI
ncbi:MAG: serine/threonine protein kinase [Myxococcales bacterium]|nr:serine/threonine protein kinase [Myxococcales bacterium]